MTLQPSGLLINEVLFNPPGSDSPNEYIELRGTPDGIIAPGTYLVNIEGDDNAPGDVNEFIDLSGMQIGSNGFLVLLESGTPYVPVVDPGANVVPDAFSDQESVSNTFFLIESAVAPSTSDDIDGNDDGTPDGAVFGGWTVLDGISILDDDDRDGGPSDFGEFGYAAIVFAENVGAGSLLFTPAGATVVDTGDFAAGYVGRFGNSTGSAPANWVVGSVEGTAPNLNLIFAETFPVHLGLSPLDHIGSINAFTPPQTLHVSIADDSMSEAGGSSIVTVTRTAADISAPLMVMISIDEPSEATAPTPVLIAGGSASTSFTISAVNDGIADGTQTATLTATATAFAGGSDSIDVLDVGVSVGLGVSLEVNADVNFIGSTAAQRSQVVSLRLTFDRDVIIDPNAFSIENLNVPGDAPSASQLIVTAVGVGVRHRNTTSRLMWERASIRVIRVTRNGPYGTRSATDISVCWSIRRRSGTWPLGR